MAPDWLIKLFTNEAKGALEAHEGCDCSGDLGGISVSELERIVAEYFEKNPPEVGGVSFTVDDTLSLSDSGVLSVNTADDAERDNTLPITSAAVYSVVGNIEVLLGTI